MHAAHKSQRGRGSRAAALSPRHARALGCGLTAAGLLAGSAAWAATSPAPARWKIAHHDIDAAFDPASSTIWVDDTVTFDDPPAPDAPLHILLHGGLQLTAVNVGGVPLTVHSRNGFEPRHFWARPDYEHLAELDLAREHEILPPPGGWPAQREMGFLYSGAIVDSLQAPKVAYSRGMESTRGIITERGVYLAGSSCWLPFVGDGTFTFTMTARGPAGWACVSQGKRVAHGVDVKHLAFDTWDEPHPMEEVYLVAGPYSVRESKHEDVALYTFTYADTPEDLCNSYLQAAGEYLDLYGKRIGPYPFAKFALVENWWQSGLGMPSFTLLGSQVIRLPFIVHTSYGHEILHNWWGNGVFVDYAKGNWCEGLTTYLADHLYKEQEGAAAARDYRLTQLQGYLDYAAGGGRDFPLREFRERESFSTQAVGYGKTMMVFHMLRRKLGDDRFYAGLARFYRDFRFKQASWDDLARSFERASGQPLRAWFDQWISRPGAPRLAAEVLHADAQGCTLRLHQQEPFYELQVPVRFTLAPPSAARAGRDTTLMVPLTGASADVTLEGAATMAVVDPDVDLFRLLDRAEIPPTLSQTLGADSTLVVVGERCTASLREALTTLGAQWSAHQNMKVVDEQDVTPALRAGRSLYLLGAGALADSALAAARAAFAEASDILRTDLGVGGRSVVVTVRDPDDVARSWSVVLPSGTDVVEALGRKLPHYGKYSYLAFDGEQNTDKGVWTVLRSPLRLPIRPERAAALGGR